MMPIRVAVTRLPSLASNPLSSAKTLRSATLAQESIAKAGALLGCARPYTNSGAPLRISSHCRSFALLCASILTTPLTATAAVESLPAAPQAATSAVAVDSPAPAPSEAKALLDDFNYGLPFFGREAVKAGANLPLPIGVMLIGQYQREDISVHGMKIGLGGQPLVDASFVGFNGLTTRVSNMLVRGDVWLFPFLNVYGIAGESWSNTTVSLTRPINTSIEVDSHGLTIGFGGTVAWGIEPYGFVTLDANLTWADQNILSSPQRTLTVTPRIGHRWVSETNAGRAYTIWFGASMEEFESHTDGSLAFNSVLPGGTGAILQQIPSDFGQWIGTLTTAQQNALGALLGELGSASKDPNARTQFSMSINPRKAWNMLVGGSTDLNRHWQLTGEGGFLGSRTSVVGNLCYRFGI